MTAAPTPWTAGDMRPRRLYLSICHAYERLGPHARSALRQAVGPESSLPNVMAAAQLIVGTTDADDLALVVARLISMSNENAASVGLHWPQPSGGPEDP